MPDVKPNETRDDFVSRCIPVVLEDGTAKDQDQAVAVCNSMWEQNATKSKLKVEYTEVAGKEILYPGTFGKGKKITPEMIDNMIENFNAGVVSPYLNLDHDDDFTDKVKDALKISRLGTVSKLYRKGEKLVADFINVPKKIAELIEKGIIGQRSIEMYKKIERAGKTFHNVLTAVSFFGRDLPAVPGLEDHMPALYADGKEERPIKVLTNLENFKREVSNMENVQISREEYDSLKKSTADLEQFKADKKNADLVALKDENEKLTKEVTELRPVKAEIAKLKAEKEAEAEQHLQSDAEAFCEKFQKQIPPAYKEDYIADFKRYFKTDPERLERWKNEIEGRKNTIFNSVEYPEGPEGGSPGKINFEDENSVEQAIQFRMKQKGVKWDEARKEIFSENGQEV